jgi:hypothetical protein
MRTVVVGIPLSEDELIKRLNIGVKFDSETQKRKFQ